jgi:hypothetical protein
MSIPTKVRYGKKLVWCRSCRRRHRVIWRWWKDRPVQALIKHGNLHYLLQIQPAAQGGEER